MGLEPTRPCEHRHLKPASLPIPPLVQSGLVRHEKELDERRIVLRPKLLEAVKVARAFGDLSENFEYKAAKQEKNKNESRIRFLENMIQP